MLDWILSESFLVNVIAYAIPIIFASYASLISNKAGISAIMTRRVPCGRSYRPECRYPRP